MTDATHYWDEDDLHPFTEEQRLHDAKYCWLLDNYGRGVANAWEEAGSPEPPFSYTEIKHGEN